MPLSPSELIRKAASHLSEVGLKKGSFANTRWAHRVGNDSPVCGIGALKWAMTGDANWIVSRSHTGHREFIIAWQCMNRAAVEEDPSIPLDTDAFMTFNDDENTTKYDVLPVMERAAALAEELA